MPMIWAEVWGGLVGLAGEYGRSKRRIAAIKAAAAGPPQAGDLGRDRPSSAAP
jgi:hypothetical protein